MTKGDMYRALASECWTHYYPSELRSIVNAIVRMFNK